MRSLKALLLILLLVPGLMLSSVRAHAEKDFTASSGFRASVNDEADLLTEEEEEKLLEEMKAALYYGNIGFLSVNENSSTAAELARSYYISTFGETDGSLFLIDMDNRKIFIFSGGKNYNVIRKSRADVIADNIYSYASKGQYYECASRAFSQIVTLLEGGRIAEPMRYIGNALLALLLALLVNFIIVNSLSRVKKVRTAELISVAERRVNVGTPRGRYTGETKKYDPIETSSGGGGFSGGGGGGGGGGGFSGGGGGHSF